MQISKLHLMAQQELLRDLNYYRGLIDGVWGPDTIDAKIKWERSGKFAPAIPNNGFPLNDRLALPPGVVRNTDGTLVSPSAQKLRQEQRAKNEPVQEAPAKVSETQAAPAEAVETQVAKPVQQNHNQQQNKQQQHQHGQNRKG